PLQSLGDPAPEVDADARNRTVGVHISVRWDVIDRDPQRSGLVLLRAIGANRRRQATAEAERGEHDTKERPETAGRAIDRSIRAAISHGRSPRFAGQAKAHDKNRALP